MDGAALVGTSPPTSPDPNPALLIHGWAFCRNTPSHNPKYLQQVTKTRAQNQIPRGSCASTPRLKFYTAKAYQIKWLKHSKSSELTAPSSSCESFLCPRQAVRRAGRMLRVQGWVWQAARAITALPRRGKRCRLPAPDSREMLPLAGFCKSPTSPRADGEGPTMVLPPCWQAAQAADGKQGWQQPPPTAAAGTCHHPWAHACSSLALQGSSSQQEPSTRPAANTSTPLAWHAVPSPDSELPGPCTLLGAQPTPTQHCPIETPTQPHLPLQPSTGFNRV